MEEGKKRAGGGEDRHGFVHVMAQVVKERYSVNLAIFQDQRDVLDGQHREIAGEAEGHLGEHGVDVGVPEDEPSAQGLADVDGQDQQGRAIADEADEHGVVDDVFEFILADDVLEQTTEKSTATHSNDGQVGPDPQGESVVVIHVGLIQSFEPAQQHGINAPREHNAHNAQSQKELPQRATFDSFGY
ncbi:hypothetical protein DESC_120048 [Desulfosarcina cetonica]|nr:hypothetical protein DESC_120048 [Desulfosarcina cetonica]